MDDDIDIEEHDLLDNPVIRKIFPDITSLKEEIPELCEEINHIKQESDEYINENGESGESNFFTEANDAEPDVVFLEQRQPMNSNKIILGSKPAFQNQYKVEVDTEEITEKIYSSKIHLVDIGEYLEKSDRYCNLCLIYFPKKDLLQDHINEVHNEKQENKIPQSLSSKENNMTSDLFQDTFRCTKCPKNFQRHGYLIKHYRTVHISNKHRIREFSKTKFNDDDPENKCFHCNEVFPSQTLLIDHIYKVLSNKNNMFEAPSKTFIKDSIIKIQQKNNKRKRVLVSKVQEQGTSSQKEIKKRQISRRVNKNIKTTMSLRTSISKFTRCLYCSYYFINSHVCFRHIQNKHRDMSTNKLMTVPFDGKCNYCSLICMNWKSYNVHLLKIHKDKVTKTFKINPKLVIPRVEMPLTKSSSFDNNVTVNLSKATAPVSFNNKNISDKLGKISLATEELFDLGESDSYSNIDVDDNSDDGNPPEDNYNPPVDDYNLGADDDSSEELVVLKSVLFKCKRCDIHFLTAKSTVNHKVHMELLINWKCLVCKKIFKKQDEIAHQKQHLNSNQFSVIELETSDLERILYKCPKCAVHFSEYNYFSHFETCSSTVAESVYCKICDFLIDRFAYGYHSGHHRFHNLKPVHFTVIVDDVITINITKDWATINETNDSIEEIENTIHNKIEKGPIDRSVPKKRRHANNTVTTSVSISNEDCVNKKVEHPLKRPKILDTDLKMTYCKSCKCFLRMSCHKKFHTKSRCANLNPYICEDCGLVITSHMVKTHKLLHLQKNNLKLQDFTFYDIKNGKQIMPPMPQYPKCHVCDVHLVSVTALISHECGDNNDYLTCPVCDIKLTESVFKLHMSFHYYSRTHDKNFQSIILNDESENSKDNKIDSVSLQDSRVRSIEDNRIRKPKWVKRNENYSDFKNKTTEQMTDTEAIVVKTKIDKLNQQTKLAVNSVMNSDYELFNVLYCCASCNTTLDLYDKVVEHCQNHVCGASIKTETCTICEMILESKNYEEHCKLHYANVSQEPFELLTFDIFYFFLSNESWLKHVFEPIDEYKKQLILRRSIYRQCKIKMKIIQNGPPDLTVYKCYSCSSIVEPDILAKHAETSCFKMRKFICSFCGLAFLSYLSQQQHESIHTEKNITIQSYRIVSFNELNAKRDNKILTKANFFFHLYQCRNCKALIDKYQRAQHKCNNDNLKKCGYCDFMIPSMDYRAHLIKHQKVSNFVQRNMKVILFGQKNLDLPRDTDLLFDGTFVDYTFYRCVGCGVCFDKKEIIKLNHSLCLRDISKVKCRKCDLLIAKSRMNYHIRLHERHLDFDRENINVIPYIANELQANYVPAMDCNSQSLKECMDVNSSEDTSTKDSTTAKTLVVPANKETEDIPKRTVKLYKCTCGLHFLSSSKIQAHIGHCDPRAARQYCSKCNLLFTPSVLFDHLHKHHGDKKYNYNFYIIEMSPLKCKIVTIYNCVNCNTHFLECENAKAHFKVCHTSMDGLFGREKCKKCNLYFYDSSVKLHETAHHKYSIADIDIVNVNAVLQEDDIESDNSETLNADDITLQADLVINSNTNRIISEGTLSEITLKNYDNRLYNCEICNTHFLTQYTYKRHIANGHKFAPQSKCSICGLSFSLYSLSRHIYVHHKKMNLSLAHFYITT